MRSTVSLKTSEVLAPSPKHPFSCTRLALGTENCFSFPVTLEAGPKLTNIFTRCCALGCRLHVEFKSSQGRLWASSISPCPYVWGSQDYSNIPTQLGLIVQLPMGAERKTESRLLRPNKCWHTPGNMCEILVCPTPGGDYSCLIHGDFCP